MLRILARTVFSSEINLIQSFYSIREIPAFIWVYLRLLNARDQNIDLKRFRISSYNGDRYRQCDDMKNTYFQPGLVMAKHIYINNLGRHPGIIFFTDGYGVNRGLIPGDVMSTVY